MKLSSWSKRIILEGKKLPLLYGTRKYATGISLYEDKRGNLLSDLNTEKRLSYCHNPGSEPLRMITLGQLLDNAAQKWPNVDAIISCYEDKKLTFQEAKDQADQLGAGLLKLGLKPGDRLALLGVNSVHWYISMLAAAKTGIITVMLNPAYTVQELEFALKNVGVRGIITDHRFRTHNYPTMLFKLIPEMSKAPHSQPLSSTKLPDLEFAIVATEDKLPGCYRLKDIKSLAINRQGIQDVKERIQPDDPICIQYSSGTTGTPKAAVLSHFALINNSYFTGKRAGMTGKALINCIQLPFFHVFGAVIGIFCGINYGNTSVLAGPFFTKEFTIDSLHKHKCNFIAGTPTMFIDLENELKILAKNSKEIKQTCDNVEAIMCGGSFIPPEVTKTLIDTFPYAKLIMGFGMTEISGCGSITFPDDLLDKTSTTIGYLVEHFEIKIVDDNEIIVPVGTPGEALFRSPFNLLEYWGDKENTEKYKTKDGWIRSGDIMFLREDDYICIIGRKKDMIIRGGENIFPAEIEEVLLQHPEIINAQVYGIDDKRLGEHVGVSIKLRPGSTLNESKVQEFCQGKISYFKIPKYVRVVDDFPLTPAGKVKKYILKELHEKDLFFAVL